jgi:hypothetical protein
MRDANCRLCGHEAILTAPGTVKCGFCGHVQEGLFEINTVECDACDDGCVHEAGRYESDGSPLLSPCEVCDGTGYAPETARQFLESRLHSKEAAIEAAIALLEWMESEAGEAQADLRDVALIASRKPEPVAS